MPTQPELAREAEWIKQILGLGPKPKPLAPGGKVCQGCGEIGYYPTIEEHTAAHCDSAGDFLAFSSGHEKCTWTSAASGLRRRVWRYCEICRGTVDALADTRRGLHWVCRECEARTVTLGERLDLVLRELASRRFEEPVEPSGDRPDPTDWDIEGLLSEPRLEIKPLRGWMPPGLELCDSCGTVRGQTWRRVQGAIERFESTCFCEGRVCDSCGRRRMRRPISNYFDPNDGHWWHCAGLVGYQRKCRDCRAADEPERKS